jgi:hypothetical protein
MPKTWKQISVRSNLLWPTIIIFSAVAADLVTFVFTDTIVRPVVVFWFLFVCPGMIVARFLRLKELAVEWTLAVAMSLAIDAIVAAIQLYAGRWSPAGTLRILIGFSLIGGAIQLAKIVPATGIKVYPIIKAMKRTTEKSVPLPGDNSHVEPPELRVTNVSTVAHLAQDSLFAQNGRTDHGPVWPDMNVEMSFSQSDCEWSVSSRKERDGQEE